MHDFDSIRPYRDDEVQPVLARLLADPEFLTSILRFRYPRLAPLQRWLLPLVRYRLRHELGAIRDVRQVQQRVEHYVGQVIRKACDAITFDGLEHLRPKRPYLFIVNHRDIVMDPAFVLYALHRADFDTPRIAIGDNLLQKPFVSDLMRLNKSFIVHRSLSGRDQLRAYQLLSAYINHSIVQDGESIWIAQAEGRAKDGDDRTDPALLKMLHLARRDTPFAQVIADLHLVPVSVSYEYDPCDLMKAHELRIRAETGSYTKAPGEDNRSIALGITGYKGRVHITFTPELLQPAGQPRELAQQVDRAILGHYRLFPVHYLAYAQWSGRDPELQVPAADGLFSLQERQAAQQQWQARLSGCPASDRPFLIEQYARPVLNHYRILQQGDA